jgi:hypothetical protein
MRPYSFINTQCALVGPGAALNLGYGAGVAEEGITFEPAGDVNAMVIGADGQGFHNLHADKSGHITVRILKTSPLNGQLAAALAFQRTSAANWGQNTITTTNNALGDTITAQQVAFAKVPMVEYAKDGRFNEWRFDAIEIDFGLGK